MKCILLRISLILTLGAALVTADRVHAEQRRLERIRRADEIIAEARDLSIAGEVDESQGLVRKALSIAPYSPTARRERAMHLIAEARVQDALKDLQFVANARPDDPGALRELGIALAVAGDKETATTYLRQAVELDSENGLMHAELAALLLDQGRTEDAVRHAEEASVFAPRVFEVQHDLGLARWRSGDLQGALPAFRRAHALAPEDPRPLVYATRVRSELRDSR